MLQCVLQRHGKASRLPCIDVVTGHNTTRLLSDEMPPRHAMTANKLCPHSNLRALRELPAVLAPVLAARAC